MGISSKTVGNAELIRVKAWFENEFAAQLAGASATADDMAAYLWQHIAGRVLHYEGGVRAAANTEPEVAELTKTA